MCFGTGGRSNKREQHRDAYPNDHQDDEDPLPEQVDSPKFGGGIQNSAAREQIHRLAFCGKSAENKSSNTPNDRDVKPAEISHLLVQSHKR